MLIKNILNFIKQCIFIINKLVFNKKLILDLINFYVIID
jgi:hypothetical protein